MSIRHYNMNIYMHTLTFLAENAPKANIQDGRHKDLIHITFLAASSNFICDIWFLRVFCMPSVFLELFYRSWAYLRW